MSGGRVVEKVLLMWVVVRVVWGQSSGKGDGAKECCVQAWRKGVVQGVEGLSVWRGVHMLKGSILDGKGLILDG